jgi:hypothetical protein
MVEVMRRCEQDEKTEPEEYKIGGRNKDCEEAKIMKKGRKIVKRNEF